MGELRWVYAGDGVVGVRCLQWLIEAGFQPVGLLTSGDRRELDSTLMGLCPHLGGGEVKKLDVLATQVGRDWLRESAVDLIVSVSVPGVLSGGIALGARSGWLRSASPGMRAGAAGLDNDLAMKSAVVEWVSAEDGEVRRTWRREPAPLASSVVSQPSADLQRVEFELFQEAWRWVHSNEPAPGGSVHAPPEPEGVCVPTSHKAAPPLWTPQPENSKTPAGRLRVIDAGDETEWTRILGRVQRFDCYHTAGYHRLAELNGEGKAHLFVYEQGACTVALPLLIRPIEGISGWEGGGAPYFDATSVYGYPGPVMGGAAEGGVCIQTFQRQLANELHARRVVSVFSRMNPILPETDVLRSLGEIVFVGNTVSIPLRDPLDVQWAQFQTTLRRVITKLQKEGVQCVEDLSGESLEAFVEVYLQTMERRNAGSYYRFGLGYFKELCSALRSHVHLVVAKAEGQVIAGALFFECEGIVQYHLSGTRNEYLKAAPMKLVIDTARRWAAARGCEYLHLGGGVGAAEDSLFHFKAGFSQTRHAFSCWKWVVNEGAYAEITTAVREHQRLAGLRPSVSNYFPAYRGGGVSAEVLS